MLLLHLAEQADQHVEQHFLVAATAPSQAIVKGPWHISQVVWLDKRGVGGRGRAVQQISENRGDEVQVDAAGGRGGRQRRILLVR